MKSLIEDLSKKTIANLEKDLHAAKQEVEKILIEARVKPQKDTNIIKKKKSYIAQIATVLQEKKLYEASKAKTK